MHSTPLLTFLNCVHIVLEFCLVGALLYTRSYRRWPSLLALGGTALVFDVLLAANFTVYARYFWLYWSWNFIAILLRLWVLADVIRSFPGAEFIPVSVPVFVAGIGSTLATWAAYISFKGGTIFGADADMRFVHLVLLTDRSVSIAWAVFLVAALCGIRILGLGWSRQGAYVCNGLVFKVGGAMIFSYLLSLIPHSGRTIGNTIGDLCDIACMAMWCYAASMKKERYSLPAAAEPLLEKLIGRTV